MLKRMNGEYLPAGQVISSLDIPVSASTLRNWATAGRIRFKRPGGKRFYHLEDVKREIGEAPIICNRENNRTVGYSRVSSNHQKSDLDRQEEYIRTHSDIGEEGTVIRDIGSGLNYNRRGLSKLLSCVERGEIGTVVVTYRDRLCRFGIELIERIFRANNTKLVVLCEEGVREGTETELANDLLDVCNYFVAKRNGQKSAKFRRERANKDKEIQTIPNQGCKKNIRILVQGD